MAALVDVTEQKRLNDAREAGIPWKKWGPYLSERQWGTVREDYSDNGDAWNYFSHDHARSRAYRWGEDGLGGLCDDKQQLCFALALWNERDPILKERLFGLTNNEANHGEDVKEYYFYVDSTPTHSYMKYLYSYPQREYPYRDLIDTNRSDRGTSSSTNCSIPVPSTTTGTLTCSWNTRRRAPKTSSSASPCTIAGRKRPGCVSCRRSGSAIRGPGTRISRSLRCARSDLASSRRHTVSLASTGCFAMGPRSCSLPKTRATRPACGTSPMHLPTSRMRSTSTSSRGAAKRSTPRRSGPRLAAHYALDVPARGSKTVSLRLAAAGSDERVGSLNVRDALKGYEKTFKSRIADADEFYDRISPKSLNDDERRVHRQALAGMLWSKQFYYFDLERWLREHQSHPLLDSSRGGVRNTEWFHMLNADVISMPDKWEYPWYAAWDLAFHTIPLSLVDFDFAKEQLLLMLRSLYAHPNGQIPAYEWNFGDVNPPVHAWATLLLYKTERNLGRADRRFLEQAFQGLMLNFNWWVNRKDPAGRNVFAGGFLGLDNIGVFDRSAPLPTGGSLEQADGTAWMAFYCQNMLEIALILAEDDEKYEEMAFKFVQHFMWIAYAMDRRGEHHDEMWDEQDGFFYDLLRLPDGQAMRLKIRSMVGLLPLCASTVFEPRLVNRHPKLLAMIAQFRHRHPELAEHVAPTSEGFTGYKGRRLLSILNKQKLERVLAYLLDENEFLGPHGIRALSRYHLDHPFVFHIGGQEYRVTYLPGESDTGMFGGNSNWRGPVWMPVNVLADQSAPEPVRLLRDRVQGAMSDRFGAIHDAVRSGTGDLPPAGQHLPSRRQRAAAGLWRHREVPGGSALARSHSVLRILPR